MTNNTPDQPDSQGDLDRVLRYAFRELISEDTVDAVEGILVRLGFECDPDADKPLSPSRWAANEYVIAQLSAAVEEYFERRDRRGL